MKLHLKTDIRGRPFKPFLRGKYYYIRDQFNGRDIWRSLYTEDLNTAKNLAYEIWYRRQQLGVQGMLADPEVMLLEVWTEYVESGNYQNIKPSTRLTREKRWKSFLKWCGKHYYETMSSITPDIAKIYLSGCGNTGKTFNNYRDDLAQITKPVCLRLKMDNPFTAVPTQSITRGNRASDVYRCFTDDEIRMILSGLETSKINYRQEWLWACQIAMYTGLRYKDVATLAWINIMGEYDYIERVPEKTSASHKAVLIRIIPELKTILQSIPRAGSAILPHLAINAETDSTKYFMRYLRGLNIQTDKNGIAGFHSFRTTVVTKAAKAGIDLKDFGGVIGHASEKQTQHYNRAALEIDLSFLAHAKK
jgi:integrase